MSHFAGLFTQNHTQNPTLVVLSPLTGQDLVEALFLGNIKQGERVERGGDLLPEGVAFAADTVVKVTLQNAL
ncbi:hypothetical protein [Hugenholtzia roseola]|uniref:hypothetical protein n=1 Tax=Hugenholtzia roseola TaxID=1002 RepID=UPI00040F1AA9|nr:hypothetical protein [Hugenholtzia roseola]